MSCWCHGLLINQLSRVIEVWISCYGCASILNVHFWLSKWYSIDPLPESSADLIPFIKLRLVKATWRRPKRSDRFLCEVEPLFGAECVAFKAEYALRGMADNYCLFKDRLKFMWVRAGAGCLFLWMQVLVVRTVDWISYLIFDTSQRLMDSLLTTRLWLWLWVILSQGRHTAQGWWAEVVCNTQWSLPSAKTN